MYENLERFNEIPTLFIDFINIHKGHTQNSCELRQKTDSEMFKFVNFQGPITHKTKEPKQLSLQLIFKK